MIRLHVDTDNDNKLSKGDFINTDLNRILLCQGCFNNITTTLRYLD